MTIEDVQAREDAERWRDNRTPMALEVVRARKSTKLTPAERAARAEKRKAERELAKKHKAAERARLKEQARLEKIRAAEGEIIELPAMVLADGTVFHVPLSEAIKAISPYFKSMCLDVETSGYWIGHKYYELRTVQLGGAEAAIVLDAMDPEQMRFASGVLNASEVIHAHSAPADVIPCVDAGLIDWEVAWGKMIDSVLLAKLSDPKLSGSDANGLKDLARDMLGDSALSPPAEKAKNELFKAMGCLVNTEVTTPVERNGWYQVNRFSETMTRYAGSDVIDLGRVVQQLNPLLPVGQDVLDREREVQAICANVAYTGFPLDADHIKKKIEEYERGRFNNQAVVAYLSKGTITNPSSPDVGEKLIKLYPELESVLEISEKTGKPSAAKASLEKIKSGEAVTIAKAILEYRHCVTTLGLLLRPLENLCDYGDSRMRPTVFTINADTGRMSCVRPNGQQFSRQGGIRKSVVADQGYLMVNADFTGCEIRVAAGLSGDRSLLEAETSPKCWRCGSMCDNLEDKNCPTCGPGKGACGLHWMAAISAFSKTASKEHRYWCKRIIFSKLFGGSAAAGARQVGIGIEDSQKIHDAFEALAPEYAAWDKWLRQCYFDGSLVGRDFTAEDPYRPGRFGVNYATPIDGRRRMIYKTFNGRQIYVNAPHAAGNYSIQGTARELLVEGLIRFNEVVRQHPEWGIKAILPVHDEVLSWCRAEYQQEATLALKAAMATDVLSSPGFDVHIDADPELGQYDFWPDSS